MHRNSSSSADRCAAIRGAGPRAVPAGRAARRWRWRSRPRRRPPVRRWRKSIRRITSIGLRTEASALWGNMQDAGPEVVANMHPSIGNAGDGRPAARIGHRQGRLVSADAACPIGPESWVSIQAAAACALAAADETACNRDSYALCRPPGHHAYASRAGGHCYLNNAAMAVERLIGHGARRVAVLDIDSHHGNGTQGIFWSRDDVLFTSVHGDPAGYYPWYVGHADELGGGRGRVQPQLPARAGTGDLGWLAALDAALRVIERFGAGRDGRQPRLRRVPRRAAEFPVRLRGRVRPRRGRDRPPGPCRLPSSRRAATTPRRLGTLLERFLTAFRG